MSASKKILKILGDMEGHLAKIETKLESIENRMAHMEKALTQVSKGTPVSTSTHTPQMIPKKGNITLTESNDSIRITGNTFDLRTYLKTFRAQWDPDNKGWEIKRKNIKDYENFKNQLHKQCNSVKISDNKKNTTSRLTHEMSKSIGSSDSGGGGCEILSSDEDSD